MGAGRQCGPVQFDARDVEPADGGGDRDVLVVVLSLQGNEDAVVGLLGDGGERAVGSDLDVAGDAVVVELLEVVGEADGVADVADPVLGIGDVAARDSSGIGGLV